VRDDYRLGNQERLIKADKKIRRMCEVCLLKEGTYRTDPFWIEIYNDFRKRFICDDCRALRADEV